jgi:hypothetical protein
MLLILSVGAELGTQFFDDRGRARYFGAAEFQPLELGQQIAARRRGQSPQILLEPLGLCHCSVDNEKLWICRKRCARSIDKIRAP